jgi:hypothetical protein
MLLLLMTSHIFKATNGGWTAQIRYCNCNVAARCRKCNIIIIIIIIIINNLFIEETNNN